MGTRDSDNMLIFWGGKTNFKIVCPQLIEGHVMWNMSRRNEKERKRKEIELSVPLDNSKEARRNEKKDEVCLPLRRLSHSIQALESIFSLTEAWMASFLVDR